MDKILIQYPQASLCKGQGGKGDSGEGHTRPRPAHRQSACKPAGDRWSGKEVKDG